MNLLKLTQLLNGSKQDQALAMDMVLAHDDPAGEVLRKKVNNISSWLSKNKGHEDSEKRAKQLTKAKKLYTKWKEKSDGEGKKSSGSKKANGSGVGKGVGKSKGPSKAGGASGQSGKAGGAGKGAGSKGGGADDGAVKGGGKKAGGPVATEDHWITLQGGQHILVKEGSTVKDAIEDHFKKKMASSASWQSKNKDHEDKKLVKLKKAEHTQNKKDYEDAKAGKYKVLKQKEKPQADEGTKLTKEGTPILTDGRAGLTQKGDESLVAKDVTKYLSKEQKQGAALAVGALDKPPNGFLLADGTGAGKTREQLAIAKTMADQGRPVIIVSPKQVINPDAGWKKISGSFADDSKTMGIDLQVNDGTKEIKPGEIHITTYNRLQGIAEQMDNMKPKPIIIWDESHNLKNATSDKAILGKAINDRAGGVVFATATPVDKASHLDYLERAGVFGNVDPDSARKELGLVQKTNKAGETYWVANPNIGNDELGGRLQKTFDALTQQGRMCKREISMNGVVTNLSKYPMPQQCKNEMAQIESMYHDLKLKGVVYLQQRRVQELYKVPHMVSKAVDDLKEGRQVVLFVDRVNDAIIQNPKHPECGQIVAPGTVGELRRQLEAAGIGPSDIVDLNGSATKKEQRIGMSRFQSGNARVVIATVASGGTGVNLDDRKGNAPRSTYVATAPLSPIDGVQLAGRTWRTTTKSKPNIEFMFGDTPIDHWNSKLYAGKMSTLHATVNGQVDKLNLPNDLSEDGIADFMQEQLQSGGSKHISGMKDPNWAPVWLHGHTKLKAWNPKKLSPIPLPKPKKVKQVNDQASVAMSFDDMFGVSERSEVWAQLQST